MLNTLIRPPPRKKTLQELADETTGSDSSDDHDRPPPSKGPRVIRGTLFNKSFTISGGDQDHIFTAMERTMHRMARELNRGAGDRNIAKDGPEYRANIIEEESETPTAEQMRSARLARFGSEGGQVSNAANAAAGPSRTRSSPRIARAHQPSPPRASRRVVVDTSEDDVPPPRAPSPPTPADPPPIPTGEHRVKNLVCPHCRDAVDRAPIRIFVLSEIVTLIRAAEATGLVGLGTNESAAASTTGAALPGMLETDLSWGGLFDIVGAETKEQRKARRAVVMDDNEDGVRRCGNCNWEIDETNGICEGWLVSSSLLLRRQHTDSSTRLVVANGIYQKEN